VFTSLARSPRTCSSLAARKIKPRSVWPEV
jgi:hypothetical protein